MLQLPEPEDLPALKRFLGMVQVAADPEIQELIRFIAQGWPEKKYCPHAVRPYFDERSELIESQGCGFLR